MASWLASPWFSVSAIFVRYLQAYIKCWLGATLSLPARAISRENPGWLLAQPALYAEPASLVGGCSDPWDASVQVTLPFAYPSGHPHDSSPRNCQSLMNSMGLRWVPFLAEVHSCSSKSQGFTSGWKTVGFKAVEHWLLSRDVPALGPARLKTIS
jgi:hypothetical protein